MERIDREEFKAQLERRTLDFAVAVIDALECLPAHPTLRVVIVQLAKSATSLGANYREANHAESRNDRTHKISIVCKEASETLYWLDVLLRLKFLTQSQKQSFEPLRAESSELLALFRSICRSLRYGNQPQTPPSNNSIIQ